MRPDGTSRLVRALGLLAGTLGVVAAFAGSPYSANHGKLDVAALARAVEREDDHVTAVELARWIKDRRNGLRVIDVRTTAEYDSYHVPGAEHIEIDSLPSTPFRADETIVLYSEGGAHAAQAWVFLRALGYDKVYFLRGGLYEWLDQVMNPGLPANAPTKDSVAFTNVAALSRYFGGVPHFGVTNAPDDAISLPAKPADSTRTPAASLTLKVRRRGC